MKLTTLPTLLKTLIGILFTGLGLTVGYLITHSGDSVASGGIVPRLSGAPVAATPALPRVPAVSTPGAAATSTLPVPLTPQYGKATARVAVPSATAVAAATAAPLDRPDFTPIAAEPPSEDPSGTSTTAEAVPEVELGATTISAEVALFVDPCTIDSSDCPRGVLGIAGGQAPPALRVLSVTIALTDIGGECARQFGADPSRDMYLTLLANRPVTGTINARFLQGAGARTQLTISTSDISRQRWEQGWQTGAVAQVAHCTRIPEPMWRANLGGHSDQQLCAITCYTFADGRIQVTGEVADSDGNTASVNSTVPIPIGEDRDAAFDKRAARAQIEPLSPTMLRVTVRDPATAPISATAAIFPYATDCAKYDPIANAPAPISSQLGRTSREGSRPVNIRTVLKLPDDLPQLGLYRLCVFYFPLKDGPVTHGDITRVEEHVVSPPSAARYFAEVYPIRGADLSSLSLGVTLPGSDPESNPLSRAGLMSDRCRLNAGEWNRRIRPVDAPNRLCEFSSRSIFPDDREEGVVEVTLGRQGAGQSTQPIRMHTSGCVRAVTCVESDTVLTFQDALVVIGRRIGPFDIPEEVVTSTQNVWQFDHTEPAVVKAPNAVGSVSPVPVVVPYANGGEERKGIVSAEVDRAVVFVEGTAIPQSPAAPPECRAPVTATVRPTTVAFYVDHACPGTEYAMTVTLENPANGERTVYSSLFGELGTAVPTAGLRFRTSAPSPQPFTAQIHISALPAGVPANGLIAQALTTFGGKGVSVDAGALVDLLSGRLACGPLTEARTERSEISWAGPVHLSLSLTAFPQDGDRCGLVSATPLTASSSVTAFLIPGRPIVWNTTQPNGLSIDVILTPAP